MSCPAAIVTCVEAGYLESQSLRMIQSLRMWGGKMADLPVVAVTPRFGPTLGIDTRKKFDELNVTYLRRSASPEPWYNFMNKPAAMIEAQRLVNADLLIWLDADLLVVREPSALILADGEDFTACPTEKNVATTGPDDPYHPYWLALCQAAGISVDDLPWMNEFRENTRIRAYFNSGVFTCRPASGFLQTWFDIVRRLLDARFALKQDGIFYHEQAALGLAMVKLKLRLRVLDVLDNYHFGSSTLKFFDPEKFRAASILHYHRSMLPASWPKFLTFFDADYPHVRKWLEPWGPLSNEVSFFKRPLNSAIRRMRKNKYERYIALCRIV